MQLRHGAGAQGRQFIARAGEQGGERDAVHLQRGIEIIEALARRQVGELRGVQRIAAFNVRSNARIGDLQPPFGGGAVLQREFAARAVALPAVILHGHGTGEAECRRRVFGLRGALAVDGCSELGAVLAPPVEAVAGADPGIELAVPVEAQELGWKQAIVAEASLGGAGIDRGVHSRAGDGGVDGGAGRVDARSGGSNVRRVRQCARDQCIQCLVAEAAPPLPLGPAGGRRSVACGCGRCRQGHAGGQGRRHWLGRQRGAAAKQRQQGREQCRTTGRAAAQHDPRLVMRLS